MGRGGGEFTCTHRRRNREIRLSGGVQNSGSSGWAISSAAAAAELLNFRLSGARSWKNIWSTAAGAEITRARSK